MLNECTEHEFANLFLLIKLFFLRKVYAEEGIPTDLFKKGQSKSSSGISALLQSHDKFGLRLYHAEEGIRTLASTKELDPQSSAFDQALPPPRLVGSLWLVVCRLQYLLAEFLVEVFESFLKEVERSSKHFLGR